MVWACISWKDLGIFKNIDEIMNSLYNQPRHIRKKFVDIHEKTVSSENFYLPVTCGSKYNSKLLRIG